MNGRGAFRFLLLVGVANLFADLTYEGARSITGPFLAQLGAGAAAVSIVGGAGEFVGYALRGASGYAADRTGRAWPIALVGYAVNVLSVPALALAGSWPVAAGFVVGERTGRAVRKPVVEGMISHTKDELGGGRAFGINEALDQAGATAGPLVVALVLALGGGYRLGFGLLLASALLCLGVLVATRRAYPDPAALERGGDDSAADGRGFPRAYWLYVAGGAVIAFGFVDFSLISYHLEHAGTVEGSRVPLYYATAMAAGAVVNLFVGRLYDRVGFPLLAGVLAPAALATPLVFWGSAPVALAGMVLWGIDMGAQTTFLNAAVAGAVGPARRSTAFGAFDAAYGVAWLGGSVAFGLLYDRALPILVALSVAAQLASLPVFFLAHQARPDRERSTPAGR